MNAYGFLHFRGVLSPDEVNLVTQAQETLEQRWLAEGVSEIRGVPIFFGPGLNEKEVSYRLPFCSELLTMTNTTGTGDAAIGLTATVGGATVTTKDSSLVMHENGNVALTTNGSPNFFSMFKSKFQIKTNSAYIKQIYKTFFKENRSNLNKNTPTLNKFVPIKKHTNL